jgi:hypothetical protein
MEAIQIYILISILVLLIIAIIMIFLSKNNKKQKPLTPLAGIAFAFIIAGICFGDNRFIGYGLMGIGVLIAIIDIILKWMKNR